ncbi:hypothetical protein BpHYR1_038362 [Brachionus plicatilis]|uniref:Uncharacterized protein n=1 Tax=Brachionus plicatilis TaxID=10195 RepID=A0A3M7PGA9_BRAPC|nr:hypothetical protein BpHYR1_038362 [Brachionus plicatilis]
MGFLLIEPNFLLYLKKVLISNRQLSFTLSQSKMRWKENIGGKALTPQNFIYKYLNRAKIFSPYCYEKLFLREITLALPTFQNFEFTNYIFVDETTIRPSERLI